MTLDNSTLESIDLGPVDLPGTLRGKAVLLKYRNGTPAVRLTCLDADSGYEEQYATFSVNIEEYAGRLRPYEFFAKTYSENEPVTPLLERSGFLEPVRSVHLVPNGHTLIPTWRIRPDHLPEDIRSQVAEMFGWPEQIELVKRVEPTVKPAPVERLPQADHDTLAREQYGDSRSRG